MKIQSVRLGADCFAFGELLGKAPQVTKGACSWLGPSFVRVPSLRSRSVGPPPSAIHGGGRLSRHPCRSAHCARPAFSLHPSRDWRCLECLRRKIKSAFLQIKGFPAEAGPTKASRASSETDLIVPPLRVGMHPVTLRVTSPGLNSLRLRGCVTTRSVGTIRKGIACVQWDWPRL